MIVITGASDGLGKEVAKLYKEAGKKVVNISRRACEHADVNICLSLREGAEIESAAKQVLEIEEPLEALINCIGVYSDQKFGAIEEDEIKRLMSTNVKAPTMLASLLIDRIKQDEADVLNVLSTAATKGKASEPLYVASKWAARGATLSLQDELRKTKSRVISFCPGGMRTNFFETAGAQNDTTSFMDPSEVALALKQTLDLPKNMEVSEIIINRK
jgi:short-subunit dehydrogenase